MEFPKYFDPKNSLNLYGLEKDFHFLSSLYSTQKLPKILMLSGQRGVGKSTLINHFIFSIFDEENYNKDLFYFSKTSPFYKKFKTDVFQNIIYLKGADFKSIKIENIRNLKKQILQSSILDKNRFIILDDIELFNVNALNALLKIIEEPSKNNYFILINNQTKPLIETIKSRSLEYKITLNEINRIKIINKLLELHNIKKILEPDESRLTPGRFIKFNYICGEYDIFTNNQFLDNLSLLLNLYKKNKDILFIDMAFYLTDFYFNNFKKEKIMKNDKIYKNKTFILSNLNKFLTLNLNQNSLINAINNELKHG